VYLFSGVERDRGAEGHAAFADVHTVAVNFGLSLA
jgi:hypothetical protein